MVHNGQSDHCNLRSHFDGSRDNFRQTKEPVYVLSLQLHLSLQCYFVFGMPPYA